MTDSSRLAGRYTIEREIGTEPDWSRDGRAFAMVRQGQPGQQAEIVYLQNVLALLDRH